MRAQPSVPALPEYSPKSFVEHARQKEVEDVLGLIEAIRQDAPVKSRVRAYVGEKGTGKTWLLKHIANKAKEKGAQALFIDLQDFKGKEPIFAISDILREVNKQLTGEEALLGVTLAEINQRVMENVRKQTKKRAILVLLLDHVYDKSDWGLLAYLDQYLLGSMSAEARTVIVLAGRGRRYPWKTAELFQAKPALLEPFSEEDTREQIRLQVPKPQVSLEKPYVHTNGYPMQNYYLALLGFPAGLDASVQAILEQVEENRRTKVREYLEAVSVLDTFDEDKIKWMLAAYYGDEEIKQWSFGRARAIREELVGYGFAKWDESASGYVLDESVRISVGNVFQYREPQRWEQLHRAGVAFIEHLKESYQFPEEAVAEVIGRPIEHHVRETWGAGLQIEFINRKREMDWIKDAIRDHSKSYILYISGKGGVGKTRLLQELGKQVSKEYQDVVVASDLIDLFHAVNRTDYGIAHQIARVLDPDRKYFVNFYRERERYLESRVFGKPVEPGAMLEALLSDWRDLAKSKRIILFLDTAERFFYQDPAAVKMGLEKTYLAGQGWIIEKFLPQVENVVVIIAGRASENEVRQGLQIEKQTKAFRHIPLQGLSLEDSLAYFDVVACAATKANNVILDGRLQQLGEKKKGEIYGQLQQAGKDIEGVRPLWLSLVIDYLALTGKLPDWEKMATPNDLIGAIFRSGRPGTELLPYIGLLPKGANVKLLSRVMREATGDARWDETYVRIYLSSETLRHLLFVKIRPEKKRGAEVEVHIHFHDEVYAWIDQNIESLKIDVQKVYGIVQKYYKAQIEEAEKHVRAFFRGGKMPLPDPSEVEEVRQDLRQHKVYFLYYKLVVAQSTPEAFDLYYVAAEDALAAEDTPLENMLTAEMQAVVHEHPDKFKGKIHGCPFEDVNAADAAIRWLKRGVSRKGYAEASQTAGKIADVIRRYGDDLAAQELEVWQGLLQIYGGGKEVEEAKKPLQGVIDKLFSKHPSHRGKAILARALNNMGYLARVEGRFQTSKSRYEEALVLWRQTGVQTQEAYTRNNLAFVLAELGHLESSLQIAADAFELRLTGGWIPMGLSRTTMAHILIRDGRLKDALEHARWALQAFQAGDYPRGQGLAYIVAAEAERRRTEEIPETAEIEQALRQAIQYAEMGIEIFKDKVTEPSRLIEAYIEVGCDYRDLAKHQRDFATKEEMLVSATESENHLDWAKKLAQQEGILYRQIDAMVNWAWLKYYVKQAGDALEILGDVDKLLGEYQLNEQGKITKLPTEENCISPCLALLGKSELLRGQIAFLKFEESKKQDDLVDPARHYARALLYDQYFSKQPFRDLRRAKGRMYERFKQLNPEELQIVVDAVKGQPGEDMLVNLLKEYALYR